MQKLLIIQLGDIGDMVLSTPALAALRERYPQAHVCVLTTPHAAPILAGTGLADRVITAQRELIEKRRLIGSAIDTAKLLLDIRRARFDAVLYFHHFTTRAGAWRFAALGAAAGRARKIGLDNGRGGFLTDRAPDPGFDSAHTADCWLQVAALAGASSEPRSPVIAIDHSGADLLPPKDDFPRIAIHAGSGAVNPARRWDAEKFAALADRLVERENAHIVLVGGKGDENDAVFALMQPTTQARTVNLTAKTSLAGLAGVLAACDRFIGADSGVMHIAAAVGVPVVAMFGSTNTVTWRPYTDRAVIARSGVRCSPCAYVGHEIGARAGCAARTCMKLIEVNEIRQLHPITPSPWGEKEQNANSPVGACGTYSVPAKPALIETERPTLHILDMPVSVITYDAWMQQLAAWIAQPEKNLHHVCTINPEMIMIARRDPVFRVVLRRADITVPDGVGLLWAAKRMGSPLPERVTGSDGVPRIAQEAARLGWKIYMLGAAPGIAEKAADALRTRYPGVQIVGTDAGSPSPDEEADLCARVSASGADILFVAYGAPEQDKWIARNAPRLRVHMAMGVGGTFDFLAGIIPRAPITMQRMGLEWLYRLYLQPWRIKRMMRLPRFVLAVLLQSKPHKVTAR